MDWKVLEKAWEDSKSQPSVEVLRIALLREILRRAHTDRSHVLATGLQSDLQLKKLEARIEKLKGFELASLEFSELVSDKTLKLKKLPLPVRPKGLEAFLPIEKTTRYDRVFEETLLRRALSEHWSVWEFVAWTILSKTEAAHDALAKTLWPHGLIFLVDSAENTEAPSPEAHLDQWQGRWILLLDSTQDRVHGEWLKTEGFSFSPTPPRIKRLFPNSED